MKFFKTHNGGQKKMKNFERRGFLGALSGSLAGALSFNKLFRPDTAQAQSWFQYASNIIQNPNDVKINVKMVYSSSIHSDSWEGPCRATGGSFGDKERAGAQAGFNRWVERTNENISPYANMLKPELVEYSYISTIIEQNEKEFAKLDADRDEVDLYFVSDSNLTQSLSAAVGKRFKKPVAMGPSGGTRIYCGAAHLRARGYEAYPCLDYNDLNSLINLLRTRKVFQQLNMLIVTDEPLPSYSSSSAVWDFEDLQSRFGIRTKIINNKIIPKFW